MCIDLHMSVHVCTSDTHIILYRYCTDTVQILGKYCVDTVQILCRYCADTVQILGRYCADTGQILCRYWADTQIILHSSFCGSGRDKHQGSEKWKSLIQSRKYTEHIWRSSTFPKSWRVGTFNFQLGRPHMRKQN